MSNKFQINIPEPCHESWNKMTPVEQGRFCNSCQKAVVDFTGMSDMQLIAFFKKPTTGSVCGRFNNDQLQSEIVLPKKRLPWLKYMLQICLPIFLTSTKAISQGKPVVAIKETNETCGRTLGDTEIVVVGQVTPPEIKGQLKGKVLNEDGEPIPFASVFIKGSKKATTSDANGYFELMTNSRDRFVTVVASSIGYEQKENVISNNPGSMNTIILKNEVIVLKEIVVTSGTVTGKLAVSHTSGFVVVKEEQDTLTGRLGGVCVESVAKDSILTTIKNFFIKSLCGYIQTRQKVEVT